jgi:perosamine synthetase
MIPVNEPLLGEEELKNVTDCIRTGWISSQGKYLEQFEQGWASYCGRRFGVAVSNGTTALQVALKCLDLRPGDEVIMPAFTIISCALAVIEAGGKPVLADCDPQTWCMDVSRLDALVTGRTRAVMAVHIYGHPVDMDPLLSLCEERGLALIEDAAEAHGAQYFSRRGGSGEWLRCGGMGTLSTFSFYANKIVTTGEGGMVLTDNAGLAERARSLRNLCFLPEKRFLHREMGYNYRMTNIQAAIGVAQLGRIDAILARKRELARLYGECLSAFDGLQLPVERSWARQVYWMYGVVLPESAGTAEWAADALKAEGIETRPFFLGMHEQPVLRDLGLFAGASYPVCERLSRQGFYLPSGLTLDAGTVQAVCATLGKILKREG